MRGRRVERRFGWDTHGLPAELEAKRQLGIKTKQEIVELGIDDVQRRVPRVGAEVHRRVARLRHAPGALGRLRPRLQDARARLHGVGHLGVQAAPRQGPGLRGLPRAALLLERPDAAVQPRAAHGRRRLQDAPGPGRHRRACASRPASSPSSGRRRRGPCRPTSASWSAPTSTTSSSSPTSPARPSATSSARPASRPTPRTSSAPTSTRPRSTSAIVERLKGTDLLGRAFTPPFAYYRGHERAHHVFPADFVTTEDGTGLVHTAGAFGEEDKIVTDAAGIEPVVPVGPDGRFTCPSPTTRACTSSTRTPHDHRPPQGRAPAARARPASVTAGTVLLRRETYDHSYPHCWRCREPLIYMAVSSLVRRGHEDQGADARAQPGDRVDALAHQGRPVRQVAGQRPRLVDLAKPLLGQPDPGVEVRQPGVPARRRLRLVRGARA